MNIIQAGQKAGNARRKQVKISVDPEIAAVFKASCAAANVSMASALSQFMAGFANANVAKKVSPAPDYSTRRRRRAAIKSIVKQLELIMDSEERYRDSIPENLQGSIMYDNADELVSTLCEAIDLLSAV